MKTDKDSTNPGEEPPENTGRNEDAVRHTQEPDPLENLAQYCDEQDGQSNNDLSLMRTTSGRTERLDNTLCPTDLLGHNMTFEEESNWISNFDSRFKWN